MLLGRVLGRVAEEDAEKAMLGNFVSGLYLILATYAVSCGTIMLVIAYVCSQFDGSLFISILKGTPLHAHVTVTLLQTNAQY